MSWTSLTQMNERPGCEKRFPPMLTHPDKSFTEDTENTEKTDGKGGKTADSALGIPCFSLPKSLGVFCGAKTAPDLECTPVISNVGQNAPPQYNYH
jgi:hypothetical protein